MTREFLSMGRGLWSLLIRLTSGIQIPYPGLWGIRHLIRHMVMETVIRSRVVLQPCHQPVSHPIPPEVTFNEVIELPKISEMRRLYGNRCCQWEVFSQCVRHQVSHASNVFT